MSPRGTLLLLALGAAVLPGCTCAPKQPGKTVPVPAPEPPKPKPTVPQQPVPPVVQNVLVPSWPPVGPDTEIIATVTDDEGLATVDFDFALHVHQLSGGKNASAVVTGTELGEGLGVLTVTVHDVDLQWDVWDEPFVLVDLSPPKGQLLDPVVKLAPGEDVRIWVADAWVLGGAELTFGGITRSFEFDPGYPATVGNAWDTSLVTFPAVDFPEGSGKAQLRVWDAVGNEELTEVDLALDGTAPEATILSPPPDSTLAGWFDVSVGGSDAGGGAVGIDVFVGGSPVATLDGPLATITVDASELAKGAVLVEAIARDAAGNESPVASVPVVIQ